MVIIKQRLDNDDHYKGQNKIEYIVIHDTGNTTDSDEANANYFVTGTRNASAHYFVDDDSITQVVKDIDGSYHVGDGRNAYGINNRNSIGIEMCRVNNKVSNKTIQNTLDLVRLLMNKYNIKLDKIVRHYDASRKNCPSSMSDSNWAMWYEFKKQIIPVIVFPASIKEKIITSKVNYTFEWQKFYNSETLTKPPQICDGLYGKNTQASLDALLGYVRQGKKYKYCLSFQKLYNKIVKTSSPLQEDGIFGDNTLKAYQKINELCKG